MDLVVYARISISRPDGLTWEDLTGYLTYARVSLGQTANVGTGNSGVDDVCRILEFRLANEFCFDAAWNADTNRDGDALIGYDEDSIGNADDPATAFIEMLFDVEHELRSRGASFHPRNRHSDWNYFDIDGDEVDEYAPLLWPQREVIFEAAVVSAGTEPTEDDWVNLFHGIMGDSISANTETGEITVLCRDKMKRLMDAYIETPKEYGSEEGTAAEVVMQQIIDDNVSHNPPQLVCPVSPGFMITPYKVEYMTVADALMQIANQIGWWLGYRRNSATNTWELTLLEPPRDKDSSTADHEIDWNEDIIIQDLDISDQDVRNKVTIIYRDADTGERASVTVEDEDSIREFGLRAMQIEESETSLIDTELEATAYGQAALHDLKDLNATSTIELPLMPELDIFNGLVVNNPVLSSTKDFFGVETIEHELDFINFRFRTHATCSGRVIGAHTRWLLMETRPGSPGKPGTLPPTQIGPSRPANVQATFTGVNVLVSWDKPTEPDYKHTRVEIWTGAVPALKRVEFTDTSYYVYTYEKNAEDHDGESVPEVFVRVIHVDMFGNPSKTVERYAINMPPQKPVGFVMHSSLSQIHMAVNDPGLADFDRVDFELALQSDYSDAQVVSSGSVFHGISVPILGDGTHYGRVRYRDKFAQYGLYATGSAEARQISREDMQGSIFQIHATSDPDPSSGSLEELWDADTTTGPTFSSAPTITFEYPMKWFFDMVRFYPSEDVNYYVQAWNDELEDWVDVAGSAAAKIGVAGNEWHVGRFDGDKMVVAQKLRIIFDEPFTLYELKFWTITFADEILAQVLHITDSMYISSLDGQVIWDHEGIKMRKPDDVVNRMELAENRIAFRDPLTGEPSIGLGFVHDLAQEIDPEANPDNLIEYGLLINHGEIRASQAVLNKSLSDYAVTRKKIEDGSVGMDTVENGSVTLKKLSDTLSVTIPDRFQRWDYKEASYENVLANPGFETGNLNGWTGNGQIETTYRHSGSYAVYQPLIYQDAPASPGEAWVASVWIRSRAVSYTYLYLYFLSASKEILSTFSTRVAKADPNWVKLTTYGIAPTNTAYARVQIAYPGSEVTVYADDAELYGPNIPESYQTFMTSTIPQTETCEQIRVIHNLKRLEGDGTFTVRGFVGGIQKYEISATTQEPTISINLDVRGIEGDLDIQIQAKATNASSQWVNCEIMQNQRLPLRGAAPSYAVSNAVASSCSGTCERSCQTTQQLGCKSDCQNTCQNVCQDTCQDPCQGPCQATCEKTSQGGGCFVEGTLVSIYDGEVQEIPIEALEPGMLMPAYDPNTDTITITECVSNERSKTGTLFVIEIEGGYTLKATGEQPFDVLRTYNEKPSWYRVPARYLKPGDTMVRPWDEDKTPKVLSVAEITVSPTWVWNPRTVAKRYIVEGFADAFLKM